MIYLNQNEESSVKSRLIAKKVYIKDIADGDYIEREGWNPNYVLVGGEEVSRANVIGVVVEKVQENNFTSIVMDDGTSNIQLRSFEYFDFDQYSTGDLIQVIGKIRVYNDDKYIVPEIITKLKNKEWAAYRKKEIEFLKKKYYKQQQEIISKETVEEEVSQEGVYEKVMKLIRNKDSGDGVDMQELMNSGINNVEQIINSLLLEGEIFEIKPGILKVLE